MKKLAVLFIMFAVLSCTKGRERKSSTMEYDLKSGLWSKAIFAGGRF